MQCAGWSVTVILLTTYQARSSLNHQQPAQAAAASFQHENKPVYCTAAMVVSKKKKKVPDISYFGNGMIIAAAGVHNVQSFRHRFSFAH